MRRATRDGQRSIAALSSVLRLLFRDGQLNFLSLSLLSFRFDDRRASSGVGGGGYSFNHYY